MIVQGNHVPNIPSSDLFDDLIRRTRLTEDAYCPIDGVEEIKNRILDDYNTATYMQIDWLYNRGNRIKKLNINKLSNLLEEMTDSQSNLEGDMCFFSRNSKLQEALIKCFEGVAKTYRYKDKEGFRKDVNVTKVQKGILLHSDDGDEVVQPSDLENIDNIVVIDYEKVSIAQRIGYYIKLFHEGSRRKGVSLMSFIISYLYMNHGVQAKDRKDNRKYVAQSIYKVNENGNCLYQYSQNHNTSVIWNEQASWFYDRHIPEKQDIYNVHIDEFIDLCERAGIDLSKEDPRDFTSEVVNNIATTYIMSNMEFIDSYLGKIDSSVFKFLSPENLLKPGSEVLISDGEVEGCYFMDAFIDEINEVLNANYNSNKSFINKQIFYTREIDTEELFINGIPYLYLWYFMSDVYMALYNSTFNSQSYKLTTKQALLNDIKKIRLEAFRITVSRIFKNPGIKINKEMQESKFYISSSEEYCSWKQVDRETDLSLNNYIVLERSVLHSTFNLTREQLSLIPEKFIVSSYGCVVGQRYSSNSSIRDFDIYKLEDVTQFIKSLVYSNGKAERDKLIWCDAEVF